jgi:hypothetical protein
MYITCMLRFDKIVICLNYIFFTQTRVLSVVHTKFIISFVLIKSFKLHDI